ncbi:MAG: L-lactate permease, partial [Hymenobacteraceae bacterium]|nr:L-lactate permease [Hymenobacteraceae bacterium]MDX5397616.1 L-lactate permease [Hymenobacteraceae bacterium]MDX5513696.1 L-lactate permease [Hymenobacteraceae bacterium]
MPHPDMLLSFVPVLLLLVLPLLWNVRAAALLALVATTVLYVVWQAPGAYYAASLVSALVATVNILIIVFGAVFLFEMMQASGYISQISSSLKNISPANDIRFFLVAIGLSGFFEGVAGFGTPGAIVPLLLISMGYQPLTAVTAVLLFDGLFAAFGAVGTPLLAGLKFTLNLDDAVTAQTGVYAAWLLVAAGVVVTVAVIWLYRKTEGAVNSWSGILLMFVSAFVPFVFFAYWLPEFATILASVLMLLVSVLVFTKGKPNINLKAWLPYLVLVLLLLLPKVIAPLNQLLDQELRFDDIFSTSVSAALKPLKSPLIPFV